MYGKLEMIVGPMFAGKTTELLKRVLWAKNGENKKVLVFKPRFDTRYANNEIVSHDGLKTDSLAIDMLPDIETIASDIVVFVDEIQFFIEPYVKGDAVAWIRSLLKNGNQVVVGGLDMDWQGTPFLVTAQLMAMADHVHKLYSNCTVCGRDATKNFKKVKNENSIELGSLSLYEARCNQHWDY